MKKRDPGESVLRRDMLELTGRTFSPERGTFSALTSVNGT